jgi:hypothetical protein
MTSTDFFENPAKMLETALGMGGSIAGIFDGNGAANAGDVLSIASGVQNLFSDKPTVGGMGNALGGSAGLITRFMGGGNNLAGAASNGLAAIGYGADAVMSWDQRHAESSGLRMNDHYKARGDADMAALKAVASGFGYGNYVSIGETAINGAGTLSGMMFGTDYQFSAGDMFGFGEQLNDESRSDGSALEELAVDYAHMGTQFINPMAGLPGMRAATEYALDTAGEYGGDLLDGAVDMFGGVVDGGLAEMGLDMFGDYGGGAEDELVFGLMDNPATDPFGGMGAGDDSAVYAPPAPAGGGVVDTVADYAGGAVDAAADFVGDLF